MELLAGAPGGWRCNQELTANQSNALLRILGDYARARDVLDQYDHQRLRVARETVATSKEEPFELTPEHARLAIDALRTQFGGRKLQAIWTVERPQIQTD